MSEQLFDQAYARWLHARAALSDWSAGPRLMTEDVDEKCIAMLDALKESEWRFIEVPALRMTDIKQRAEFVRQVFDTADNSGAPTDNRHRAALATLITEILRYSGEADEAVSS